MSSRRVGLTTLCLAPVLIVLALAATGSAGVPGARTARAAARPARTASAKPFTAKLSYDQTNPGRQHGPATVGIVGKGAFSAKLSPRAALAAAVIALVTGVPVPKIARGGTYVQQWDVLGNGDDQGVVVASFKAHGLGTLCLSYLTKHGRFAPGDSFIPASGRFKVLGGTGAAARWRVSASYKQTNVTGSSVENFSATGSEQASTGKPRRMTAACRRVAKLA